MWRLFRGCNARPQIGKFMKLSDFGLNGGSRKTLVVLGAGASRGASFVNDPTEVLPPLDLDFFQQLSRMSSSAEANRLLAFIRQEYGHEVGLSMERFFSEADYTDRFHSELSVDVGPNVRRYRKALEDFFVVLPQMLNLTTIDACEYHAQLANMIHTQDAILSFNYDCLADAALRDNANNRWDPDKGSYGFDVSSGGGGWKKHSAGRPVSKSIRLLKMHGSMNWAKTTAGAIRLVQDLNVVKTLSDSIIPPTWFKDLTKMPYGDVWRAARKEIRTSRILVVIGYSVPSTDLFSKSLFKVEAGSKEKREKLDLLVVVNPDQDARCRFLEIIRDGLESSTRILEYRTFKELHGVLLRNSIRDR